MSTAEWPYEPHEHVQVAPVSTVDVDHRFGRSVSVYLLDTTTGKRIGGRVEEIDEYTVRISFYRKSAAFALGLWKAVIC